MVEKNQPCHPSMMKLVFDVRQIGRNGVFEPETGADKIAEVSITTDSDQNKITFLTYFCMLNRLKEQSDDKGFVLKEISEMKWGSAIRGTAPKGMSISRDMVCHVADSKRQTQLVY